MKILHICHSAQNFQSFPIRYKRVLRETSNCFHDIIDQFLTRKKAYNMVNILPYTNLKHKQKRKRTCATMFFLSYTESFSELRWKVFRIVFRKLKVHNQTHSFSIIFTLEYGGRIQRHLQYRKIHFE